MGDANASIPTVQPVYGRPMWGAFPRAAAASSVAFVSKASIDSGTIARYALNKRAEAVVGCRKVRKSDMKWNDAVPKVRVDPESFEVWADNERVTVPAAVSLPLGKAYNLF
jgi:urease